MDLFAIAIVLAKEPDVRADAVDNFLLFVEKILKDSELPFGKVHAGCQYIAFNIVRNFQDDYFMLFARSYYQIDRLAETLLARISEAAVPDYEAVNEVLLRYYKNDVCILGFRRRPFGVVRKRGGNRRLGGGARPFVSIDISRGRISELTQGLEEISEMKPFASKKVLSNLLQLPGYKSFVGHLSRHAQEASFRRRCQRPGQAMEAAVSLSHYEHHRAVHDSRGVPQGHQPHPELADRKREAVEPEKAHLQDLFHSEETHGQVPRNGTQLCPEHG